MAVNRSAVPDRFVLSQRRHVQILRGCWRTRLPVSWQFVGLFKFRFVWNCFWWWFLNCCAVHRCAEGYKGQRCENKDIYNLASKYAYNGLSLSLCLYGFFSIVAIGGIKRSRVCTQCLSNKKRDTSLNGGDLCVRAQRNDFLRTTCPVFYFVAVEPNGAHANRTESVDGRSGWSGRFI